MNSPPTARASAISAGFASGSRSRSGRRAIELRTLLDEQRIDVVVCHMAWPYATFAPVVRGSERSLVFWLHMATEGRHWLERWSPNDRSRSDGVAPSRFVAATMPAVFRGIESARVVHYAVAPPGDSSRAERTKVRAELNTPADAIVIVQACRLEQVEGAKRSSAGAGRVARGPGMDLLDGGRRPGAQRHEARFLESLKAQASEAGIAERVRFAGQRSDVPRVLAAADIYCQPNTGLEGLPIILTEALDARLPIVTSDLGGFEEIVDDCAGFASPLATVRRLPTRCDRCWPIRRRGYLGAAGPARARSMCDPVAQIKKMKTLFRIDSTNAARQPMGLQRHRSL